jgi:signal transduction histidine kinase
LVSRAPIGGDNELASLGWQVQLGEPSARVYLRADAVAYRILWISLGLGAITALFGVQAARQLTQRLRRLTLSVTQVGADENARLDVPAGVDEVARLGSAFARILGDLQEERRELERRVAVRTREVERLAAESRYASIVRERLQIARDLHDTLAHSMMAMLSEIRLMRRLHQRDPQALGEELQRAEEVAHNGLIEVRKAIPQMRSSAVRETGLGPALAAALNHFIDRTGITGEFAADPEAARFGDERGETFLRIAQEALRNVERHAQAMRVSVALSIAGARLVLSIVDDGVGFDPARIAPGHFGLIGLREQAELIGGELCIDSRLDQGTTITLAVSLAPVSFPGGA